MQAAGTECNLDLTAWLGWVNGNRAAWDGDDVVQAMGQCCSGQGGIEPFSDGPVGRVAALLDGLNRASFHTRYHSGAYHESSGGDGGKGRALWGRDSRGKCVAGGNCAAPSGPAAGRRPLGSGGHGAGSAAGRRGGAGLQAGQGEPTATAKVAAAHSGNCASLSARCCDDGPRA